MTSKKDTFFNHIRIPVNLKISLKTWRLRSLTSDKQGDFTKNRDNLFKLTGLQNSVKNMLTRKNPSLISQHLSIEV